MNKMISPLDHKRLFIAVCALGSSGVIVFVTLPALLGAIANSISLTDNQIGTIASSYFVTYTLVTLSSVTWARRANWRIAGMTGFSILITGLVLGAIVDSYYGMIAALATAGIGSGIAFSLSFTIITHLPDLDRKFAFKTITEQVIPALLLFTVPVWITPQWDYPGFFSVLAITILLLSSASFVLPNGCIEVRADQLTKKTDNKQSGFLVWIGLLAMTLYFGALAGVWTFIERMGSEQNFDPTVVEQSLALAAIMGAVGPLIASFLGDRFGRVLPIIGGTLIVIACLGLLSWSNSQMLYTAVVALLPGGWYFVLVYQMSMIASADISGRYAVLISSAMPLGAIFGPITFAMIKSSGGLNAALSSVCVICLIAVSLLILINVKLDAARLRSNALSAHLSDQVD